MGSGKHLAGLLKGWAYLGLTALFLVFLAWRFESQVVETPEPEPSPAAAQPPAPNAAAQQTTPATQGSSPAIQPTTPATQGSSPAIQPTTPVSQGSSPAIQPTTPVSQGSSPAIQPTLPANPPNAQPTAETQPANAAAGQAASLPVGTPGLDQGQTPTEGAPVAANGATQPAEAATEPPAKSVASGQPAPPPLAANQPEKPTTALPVTPPAEKSPLPTAAQAAKAPDSQTEQKAPLTDQPAAELVPCSVLDGDPTASLSKSLRLEWQLEAPKPFRAACSGEVMKIHHHPSQGYTLYLKTPDNAWCVVQGGLVEVAAEIKEGTQVTCGTDLGLASSPFLETWLVRAGLPWWRGVRVSPEPYLLVRSR